MNLATSQGFSTESVCTPSRTRRVRSFPSSCKWSRGLASACAFFASALVTLSAYPITRIGNAKFGSEDLGFEATLARPFTFVRSLRGDGALLVSQGDDVFRGGEPLVVGPLSQGFPGTDDLTREQFRRLLVKILASKAMVTRIVARDSCVEAYIVTSGPKAWGLAGWGAGRGVVFQGDNEDFVVASIGDMLASVEVAEGACAWPAAE